MGTILRKGQRLRPLHPQLAQREWGVRGDEVGTVLCCYKVLIDRFGAAERVDVEFGGHRIWGAPADEFAVVPEVQPRSN
jgi:hypothetical protein